MANSPSIFKSIVAIVVFLSALLCNGALDQGHDEDNGIARRRCRIVFYNVENLFDISDDSLTMDDDYTPHGNLHWTKARYHHKLRNLSKTIVAVGGWQIPDIIGMCEVENDSVLFDLFKKTPLSKFNFQIIHKNSDDPRGIDVALVYNGETVTYLNCGFHSLTSQGLLTRNILYFKAIIQSDTCHFFVNHWPSRSGGQLESEPARVAAAKLLRNLVDSIFLCNQNSNIIIMGDFNDEPQDISLSQVLQAQTESGNPVAGEIFNLSSKSDRNAPGTIKYQGQWSLFDQFIVSGSLLVSVAGCKLRRNSYQIFYESFLLTDDEQYNGKMPYRTYIGYRYQGGFSDHLPVYIDLE